MALNINQFVTNHFKKMIFIEMDSTHRIKLTWMTLLTIFLMMGNIKLVLLKILLRRNKLVLHRPNFKALTTRKEYLFKTWV